MRWLKRGVLALLAVVVLLLAPVGYNEFACRGEPLTRAYAPLIAPEHHRAEAASYLTYPEWHIVFAYDDYARILAHGDPHDFGYFRAITGFWTALCNLTETADQAGGAPDTKNMDYVIGVSFTAEMLAKAAYEETLGRIATWLRAAPSTADRIAARQARDYAAFLHQIPWYNYDFIADAEELAGATGGFRDIERRWALGLEYRAKSAYAGAIAQLAEAAGPAKLTIRSIVTGLSADELGAIDGVTILRQTDAGVEIETPRYAAFTAILRDIAALGGQVPEIAGNDQIMVTVTGDTRPDVLNPQAILAALPRQGYDDTRWLVRVPLSDLTDLIRRLEQDDARLEHIFDY